MQQKMLLTNTLRAKFDSLDLRKLDFSKLRKGDGKLIPPPFKLQTLKCINSQGFVQVHLYLTSQFALEALEGIHFSSL